MNPKPPPLGWQHYLYNGILLAGAPFISGYMSWRSLVKGRGREGLPERFAHFPPSVLALKETGDPIVWMHAASVGEVAVAASVIAEIRRQEPLARLVLSTTTHTGHSLAVKRQVQVDALVYFPIDAFWIIRRALRDIAPDLLVTVETELWPNLFSLAHHAGIRTAVVNGRLSDRSFRQAKPLKWYYAWLLGRADAILAQSKLDSDRYTALGADPERVEVTGNVKFDEAFPVVSPPELAKLRQDLDLAPDVPVWVVGSTHDGEEALVLDAYAELRLGHHALQLIIAPRHPERVPEVEALVRERGYRPVRRTDLPAARRDDAAATPCEDCVLLVDTIGELSRMYALADVVFVGGSLVRKGGHNVLEAIAQGKPTLVGPHMHNFRDITRICLEGEAVIQIARPAELADAVGKVLSSPAEANLLSVRARRVIEANKGASARTAQRLVELLKSRSPGARQTLRPVVLSE